MSKLTRLRAARVVRAHGRRPKRTQEERRRSTQESVLNAAMEVLIEVGFARFTTAEVAARAGVSRGAQMNYFRTRDDLILATGRSTLAKAQQEALAIAERSMAARNTLESFLRDAERFFLGKHYTAMMEVTVAARTDPALAREIGSLLAEYRRTLNKIWIDAFCRAGYERGKAEELVKLTNHIYRGMALTAVWAGSREEDRRLRRLWAAKAKQLLKSQAGRGKVGNDSNTRRRLVGRIDSEFKKGSAPPV